MEVAALIIILMWIGTYVSDYCKSENERINEIYYNEMKKRKGHNNG